MDNQEQNIIETINRLSSSVRFIIFKNLKKTDNIDPEDIEQEIKIKIWKSLLKGKKIKKLSSYICRIAYTVTIDELRKMRKHNCLIEAEKIRNFQAFYEQFQISSVSSPESVYQQKELEAFMLKAINSLSDNRRQVLQLYAKGLPVKKICDFLGWNKDKVRHLLYRGIDDLKKNMERKKL